MLSEMENWDRTYVMGTMFAIKRQGIQAQKSK